MPAAPSLKELTETAAAKPDPLPLGASTLGQIPAVMTPPASARPEAAAPVVRTPALAEWAAAVAVQPAAARATVAAAAARAEVDGLCASLVYEIRRRFVPRQ